MPGFVQNPDGSYLWTGNIYFSNFAEALDTGVATLTLSPAGGSSTLPALLAGTPGLPCVINTVTVNTLDPTAVPAPTQSAVLTLIDPGGAGQAAVYSLTLNLLKGEPGTTGATGHILGSSDFSNSPANGQVPVYNSSTGLVAWSTLAPIVVPTYTVPATNFSPLTMTTSQSAGVLATLNIPAQLYRYRPRISGVFEVLGALGMRIDGQVMMGTTSTPTATIATSGTQIGYGHGMEATVPIGVPLLANYQVAMAPSDSSPAAVVNPGTAMTVVVSAVRVYGSQAWTTAQSVSELHVYLDPA